MLSKILKGMLIAILSIVAIIIIVGAAFVYASPQFGGKHTKKDIERYEASGHYKNGKFQNLIETNMDMSFSNMLKTAKEFYQGGPNRKPDFELPMEQRDSTEVADNKENRLIWFGHSAFLMQLDGKKILLDPMFGNTPAPHPTIGTKRYAKKLPLAIEKLPEIDAIVLSHDHYDHLDYESILALKDKTKMFFVPLGVGAHLKAWGISENDIVELNWWDHYAFDGIDFSCTPSRHFSGRGLGDNSSTMWASWVIRGDNKNIYFSGDSGYGPHFKEIGEKYGPFDFAMLECGQYNEKWASIHMMPEETVQASIDVNAKTMMPIHWGAFTLALHAWNDPIIRASKKAKELNVDFTAPIIGQTISLDRLQLAQTKWW